MGIRTLIAFGVMASACIDPSLVPCGDLACPGDKICSNGACLFAEQLSACEGAVDDTACTYPTEPSAVCVDGVCQPLGCGNGVVTPDEVCDDGNNVNGDGCSADCTSTERCGNGLIDLSSGEQCDDGNTVNDDDCRDDCQLPRCGDGIVDTFEECEASSPDPLAVSCTDLGYDEGDLGCAPTCTYDTKHTCQHYGWQYLRDTTFAVLAGDHGVIALVEAGGLAIEAGNTWTTRAGPYIDVDVVADRIAAATSTSVAISDAAGPWVTLPDPPLPTGGRIARVRLAPDGTPVVLVIGDTCQVDVYDQQVWSAVVEPTSACSELVVFAKDNFVVTTPAPGIEWTTPGGGHTSAPTNGTVFDAQITGGSVALFEVVTSPTQEIFEQLVPQGGGAGIGFSLLGGNYRWNSYEQNVIVSGGVVYASNGQEFAGTVTMSKAGAGQATRTELITAPPDFGAPAGLYRTRDGHIYGRGSAPAGMMRLYELGAFISAPRAAPSTSDLIGWTHAAAVGNSLVVCGSQVWQSTGSGWATVSTTTADRCTAIWGANTTSYVSRVFAGVTQLWRYNGGWTEQLLAGGHMAATAIAGAGGLVYAVLPAGVAALTSGTWGMLAPLPGGCAATALAVSAAGVFAGGACNGAGRIWQLGATAWTEVLAEPLLTSVTSLFVADNGTIFAASSARTVLVGTASGWHTYPNIGVDLSGTSATDVFAASGRLGVSPWRWDGLAWSQLQIDPMVFPALVVATPTDVAFIGSPNVAPLPITWIELVRGP